MRILFRRNNISVFDHQERKILLSGDHLVHDDRVGRRDDAADEVSGEQTEKVNDQQRRTEKEKKRNHSLKN